MIDKEHLKSIDKKFKCDEWGKYSRFFSTKESVESLGLEYKEGRAIKVLVGSKMKTMEYAKKIALIQAFFAYLGVAPKVYKIGMIGKGFGKYPYLEVEYLNKKWGTQIEEITKSAILNICEKCNFITPYEIDLDKPKNYIGDKYIDFHGFEINDKFKEWLFNEINEKTHWGRKDQNKRFSYQTEDELKGKRDTNYRIKRLGLDKIDFTGKTVLDVGCNLGVISNFIASRGGKVLGIDTKELKELAQLYKIYKNPELSTEFQKVDLSKTKLNKFGKFDFILSLAMVHTIGIPKELNIGKECIFEGHNLMDPQGTANKLKEIFNTVEYLGLTEDRGKRPIFRCNL